MANTDAAGALAAMDVDPSLSAQLAHVVSACVRKVAPAEAAAEAKSEAATADNSSPCDADAHAL